MGFVWVHMVCSLLSYVAFLIASLAGLCFLVQERQLKRKQMGWLFHRLSALDTLDRLNFRAIGIGFLLLSVGLFCGVVGARTVLGHWWTGDPKEWFTAALWVLYFGVWVARARAAARGRRIAVLSVLGFSLVMLTFLGVNHLLSTWHAYI